MVRVLLDLNITYGTIVIVVAVYETIITSVKKFIDSNNNKNLDLMLSKDIWATNVYTLGYEYGSFANLDFTHKLIIANGSGFKWQ